jgi:hypothetical protein
MHDVHLHYKDFSAAALLPEMRPGSYIRPLKQYIFDIKQPFP